MTRPLTTIALLFAPWLALGAAEQKPAPNVIYILADDLGYGDLSCYGQKKFQAPHIDRLASEVELIDPNAALRTKPAVAKRKDGRLGMRLIVLLDRVPNRLDAAIEFAGNATVNVRRHRAHRCQPTGPRDDLFLLFGRQLAEAAASLHPRHIAGGKLLHLAHQKTNPPATSHLKAAGHQAVVPPAGDRLGGDVESSRDLFDGEHLILRVAASHQAKSGRCLISGCLLRGANSPLRREDPNFLRGVGERK